MEGKKPPKEFEAVEIIENFCSLLKEKKRKDKNIRFYMVPLYGKNYSGQGRLVPLDNGKRYQGQNG
jgi:hypothetical protein